MTVATYTSDLTDIYLFESTGGVSAYGGGGAGLGAGVDYAMEGTNAVDKQINNAEKGFMYDNTANFTIGTDDHFFIWIIGGTPGGVDTRDNRGIVACIGDDTSNFVKFHVNGSDTLPLGGAQAYALRFANTTATNLRTLVGSPGTTPSWIGGGLSTTVTIKFANLGVDGARIGTGYDVLHGTGADPEATLSGIATDDESTSEGIFQNIDGGFSLQGKLRFGDVSNPCELLDSDALIVLKDTIHSLTDFTEVLIEHASSIITLTRITFLALGTNNPGRFEVVTSSATVALSFCTFQDFGATVLGTGSTFASCVWINCDVITANGADLAGSSVTNFEGTADTSSLLWNTSADPNGELDGMSFTKGTAATHAMEFTSGAPLTSTLTNWTTSGYNASDAQNDSTFLFADRGSDVTWTVNIIGGAGEFSYKKARAGDTVNIVIAPVTHTFRCFEGATDTDLQGVGVLVYAGPDTGDMPAEDAITSITRSGQTATCTTTAVHGLATDDVVLIKDTVESGSLNAEAAYTGTFVITVTSTTVFTYTVVGSPTTPVTRTYDMSQVIIDNDQTDVNGEVSDTRTYSAPQAIIGVASKPGTATPYKTQPISGTVSDSSNTLTPVPMVAD